MLNGNETKDYMISLDFAKHISMQARTQKSHEMRNYFIECEKQLKDLTPKFANMSPQLQLLIKMEQQQNEIKATLDQDLPICMELMLMTRPQTKQGAKHLNCVVSVVSRLVTVEVQSLVKSVHILKKYCMKYLTY